jgi:ketosteroid isomerase-like protein
MESTARTTITLEDMARRHQAHMDRFFNGDPPLEDWVHDETVSLHGGFGFTAKGWEDVRNGLIRAAGRLAEGQMRYTPIGGQIAGDFAYEVGMEEGTVRVDAGERRPMRLKVTIVFRQVDGQWLCVHRHGEMLR